jgi:rhodanese-related sulfurtransferase
MRTLGRAFAIVLLGALLGLLSNGVRGAVPLSQNAFLEKGDQQIDAKEARERLEKGALFLDARPLPFYEMSHIPGARSLPEDEFDQAFASLEPLLRGRFDVVVYCAGFGCEASLDVARRLKAKGIPAVVLAEGWPAWQDAGYPETKGKNP